MQHADVAIDLLFSDAAALQPLARQRHQVIADQDGGRHRLAVEPGELRAETETRGGREVHLGVLEIDRPGHVRISCRHGADQPEPESGVRHLVQHRRPGRQHPVLDAQMRLAVELAVAGAVPAVHRAVVQPERLEQF